VHYTTQIKRPTTTHILGVGGSCLKAITNPSRVVLANARSFVFMPAARILMKAMPKDKRHQLQQKTGTWGRGQTKVCCLFLSLQAKY
jgi:hypothetical protein